MVGSRRGTAGVKSLVVLYTRLNFSQMCSLLWDAASKKAFSEGRGGGIHIIKLRELVDGAFSCMICSDIF